VNSIQTYNKETGGEVGEITPKDRVPAGLIPESTIIAGPYLK
jgi:hypothetical protein